MTLQEILTDVDTTRVPGNTVSATQKVIWLNQVQRQLFRRFPLPEAVDRFQTTAGASFYPLPDKCTEDSITGITAGGVKYDYQPLDDEAKEEFWTIVSGQIMLYPEPEEVVDAFVYFRTRHNELSEFRLDETPNFPEDFHELLVLELAKRVARAGRDTELANNFEADCKELRADAARLFKKQRPKAIEVQRAAVSG